MIRGFCTSILVNLVIVFITPFVFGQSPEPNIDGISIESQKRYKDTQDFIKKTQKRIDQLRKQSDLREKNIELLATKVTSIVNKMSGQGEDNTALLSKISGLTELLELERKTSSQLRNENTKLRSQHKDEIQRKENILNEIRYKLKNVLNSLKTQEQDNKKLTKNINKLEKENLLLKNSKQKVKRDSKK